MKKKKKQRDREVTGCDEQDSGYVFSFDWQHQKRNGINRYLSLPLLYLIVTR